MAFIDSSTLNVLTVLVIDMAGAILIFFGFLWVRSIRGDRKIVRSSYTNKMVTEVVFEDSMQDSKVQDSIEYDNHHQTPNPTQGATTKGGLTTDYKHDKDIKKENLQFLNTDKGLKYQQQDPNRKSKSWWLSSESDDSREMEFKPPNSPRNNDYYDGLQNNQYSLNSLGQQDNLIAKQKGKNKKKDQLEESELPLLANQRQNQRVNSLDIEKPNIIAKRQQTTPEEKQEQANQEFDQQQEERFLPTESNKPERHKHSAQHEEQAENRKFSIMQKFLRSKRKQQLKNDINKNTVTSDIDEQNQPQGMLDWYHILKTIKDQDLKLICGTDAALYIVFQRLAAKFFAILTVVNFAVFVPIYITGGPSDPLDVQDTEGNTCILALTTVMNITGNIPKVTLVYFLINSIYLALALGFMYFYWRRSVEWRYKKHSHKQRFVDHDIALHSIMVSNIDRELDLETAKRNLDTIFHKIFPHGRVIATRVIGKLDDLYNLALRLKDHKKYYRYYKKANKQARKDGDNQRKMFYKRRGCCKGMAKFDAEEYFKKKIKKRCLQIKTSEEQRQKENGGFGFVTFISNLQVKQCLHKNFKKLLNENLTSDELRQTQALSMKIHQAPSQSDIIWENMYNSDIFTIIKSYFLIIILFIICVLIVTPVSILDNLQPILNYLFSKIGEASIISKMISTYISPIILLIFNSGIVPVLIDIVAALEGSKLKSLKQLGIMRKNFFFMIMNVIFLQLTAQATILSFLDYSLGNQFTDLPSAFGKNLVNNNYFFLRFTIQITFISNGIQLLDIPHHSIKMLKYMIHLLKQRKEIIKKPFVDDFAYDLGYYQSQTIVFFAMGLIFSGTMPVISLFATLFFTIRYYIEKYNLTFSYNKEFEGGGVIKKQVLPFMMLAIYLFEFLNLGYFTFKFGDMFFKWGLAFIAGQTILIILLNFIYSTKKKKQRSDLAKQVEQLNNAISIEEYHKQNQKLLREEDEEIKAMEQENKTKNKVAQFIDSNILLSTERRLTLINQQLLADHNTKILLDAYKHPFEKIPESYFDPNLGY